MEHVPPPSSVESLSFVEIKYGRETTKANVIEKILEEKPIQFLCTKYGDLYLSDMGHEACERRNGIDKDEIATRGWMKLSYNCRELNVSYEQAVTPILKKTIQQIFITFQTELKNKKIS